MEKQNKVFIYSIQHTGTHFVRDLIETSTRSKDIMRTAKHDKIGPIAREKHNIKKMINLSISKIPKDKTQKAKLMIFFSHHFRQNTGLYNSILNDEPPIPCICPMRDPLLFINTSLFWGKRYNDPDFRIKITNNAINIFTDLLSLPDEHRFLFPVDLYSVQMTQTQRTEQLDNLFKFCNLKQTDRTKEFNKCKPAHETKIIARRAMNNRFLDTKAAIINKDIKFLRKNMNIELVHLQKQEKLKKKLEHYGYRDLVWW